MARPNRRAFFRPDFVCGQPGASRVFQTVPMGHCLRVQYALGQRFISPRFPLALYQPSLSLGALPMGSDCSLALTPRVVLFKTGLI